MPSTRLDSATLCADTGRAVVERVSTDLAVIDVTPDGQVLVERAPGVIPEEVLPKTERSLG